MQARPINAVLAIVISLMPLPALWLLDHANRGCGDGLCGFFSGILILGTLVVATIVFLVRSARRNETPHALRIAPLILWVVILFPRLVL